MTEVSWFLMLAVFGAAYVQAATGIGFGLIAGPFILIAMNSGEAIQVSIILTFLVAVLLARGALRHIDITLIKKLFIGTLLGAPVGIVFFNAISIETLKIAAGVVVMTMALSASGLLGWLRKKPLKGTGYEIFIGALSGILGTALAMPGPPIAWLMASEKQPKNSSRGTMLTVAIFSSPISFAVQATSVGTSSSTLMITLMLLPATFLGTFSGKLSCRLINEQIYQRVIVWILVGTTIGLFVSINGARFT